ncbi:MAG: MarR family winged helix-turn-helix transcriptional regulator [Sulfolobales archaeon]
MSFLTELKKLSEPIGGVKPSFDVYHAYLALVSLYHEAPMGRLALSKKLALGEASVKTLIKRMRSRGFINVDKVAGIFLTREGLELVENLNKVLDFLGQLDISDVCANCEAYGVVIKKFREVLAERIGYLKLRDQIVREGAEGAIIVYCGDVPVMPVSGGLERAEGVLRDIALKHCSGGDVLAMSICYNNRGTCARALVNAVLKILDP